MAWLASNARRGAIPDTWQAEVVGTPKGRFIATVIGLSREEAEANATLFAAAPETAAQRDALLEVLQQLMALRSFRTLREAAYEYPHGKEDVADELAVFGAMSAAIAAATGEAP